MKSSEIVQQIEIALAQKGMSKAEFYDKCKVSRASFSQWRHDVSFPGRVTLERINNALETNFSVFDAQKETPAAQGDGLDVYRNIISGLCGNDQEKFRLLQDALSKNPKKTKASFDLFLKTL